VLGFLLLTSYGAGVVLSILGPTVPAIAAHLHVAEAALGLVFTASFVAATIATAGSGALLSPVGSRVLLTVGLAAMALGLLIEGTAPTLPLVAAGGAVAGIGVGGINVAVNAATVRLYAARRGVVLTWLNVSFGAGAFCTPLLAGLVLTRHSGYTATYLLGSAVLIIPIVPLLLGLPPTEAVPAAARRDWRALQRVLSDRQLLLLMAIAALYLGAEIGFGGWIVTIIAEMTRLPPAQLTVAASAFWICLALGGAPTVALLRRDVRPRQLIVFGSMGAAGASVLLVLTGGSVALAIVWCAALGLTISPVLPMVTVLATSLGGAESVVGPRVAAIYTAAQLGGATLPALQGFLVAASPGIALGLTAACALAMMALALAVGRDTRAD
jgi:fucose permease